LVRKPGGEGGSPQARATAVSTATCWPSTSVYALSMAKGLDVILVTAVSRAAESFEEGLSQASGTEATSQLAPSIAARA
jgi:hypothetical protein